MLVEIPGTTAIAANVTSAAINAYSSMSWPRVSLQIPSLDIVASPNGQKNETTRGQSKIDDRHEKQEVCATAGVRDGRGEPYSEGEAAFQIAVEQSRACHSRRDWEALGAQSAPRGCLGGQTRHHP